MKDKEKINNLVVYLLFVDTRFKNDLIERHNQMILKTDTFNTMEYFKAYCKYETLKEISTDIEKIISDF